MCVAGTGQRRKVSEKRGRSFLQFPKCFVTTLKHSTINTKMGYSEVDQGNYQEMLSRSYHMVLAKEAAAQGILFGCLVSRASLGARIFLG